ncbi:MAG: hypothetical protein LBR53_10740 [Deltaproteobacteria bacterium]|nr:hypothetical protein [Deltaproteobacteria bacterium]
MANSASFGLPAPGRDKNEDFVPARAKDLTLSALNEALSERRRLFSR